MSEPDIDAERVAALLDGRLPEAERAELLSRLATSSHFRELAETAAVLRELELAGTNPAHEVDHEPDPPAPTPSPAGAQEAPPSTARPGWRRRPVRWLALAASLAVAALAIALWQPRRGTDAPGAPALRLASRDAGLPAGWTAARPWQVTLGGGAASLIPSSRAVRAGVLHTDLVLAARAGDHAEVTRLVEEMEDLLTGVSGGSAVIQAYRTPPAAATRRSQTIGDAGELLSQLLGTEDVRWGAWLEAARIAAARQDTEFFLANETRATLRRATRPGDLPETARTTARRLDEALRSGGPRDWPTVRRDLDQLLAVSAS